MKTAGLRVKLYKKYSEANGSQHIASEYAISKIYKLVRLFKIKFILEIGLGIGSISGIIIALSKNINNKINYTGTEVNGFCLKALKLNLGNHYDELYICEDLSLLSSRMKYDLIIIDGKDENLKSIKNLLSHNGIIVIEGDRIPQFMELKSLFPNLKYVQAISCKKNKNYSPFSPSHWRGGLKIIFVDPTYFQNIWWLREKIFTKMKYIYRSFIASKNFN